MEKMKKTAKALDTVFKCLFGIVVVAAILVAVAVVILLICQATGDNAMTMTQTVELGHVVFELAQDQQIDVGLVSALAQIGLAAAFLVLVCLWINTIRDILKPMKEGLPFHGSIADNLKKLGWLEIFTGIVMNALDLVDYLTVVTKVDMNALFLSDKIVGVEVDYGFDITFLVTAAVFFLASYIFRYGAQLQTLSDETL